MIRVAVVGLGIQGKKRVAVAGPDVVVTVDPVHPNAQYKRIEDVPLDAYDAALVCTPDQPKMSILGYLAAHGKHAQVEKPLLGSSINQLLELKQCFERRQASCYTAYNHRFEPHFIGLKNLLGSGQLGPIYSARFFYGNGTARDARNSAWRDQGMGVLADLGSHLLDTILYLFSSPPETCRVWRADRFENRSYDHFFFGFDGDPVIDCEMSMLSYRNTFHADIFGENGSAHVECLCKWGPSTLTVRRRVLPSGRPDEESTTLVCADPTWALEYWHFQNLCRSGSNNLANDVWIQQRLESIQAALA